MASRRPRQGSERDTGDGGLREDSDDVRKYVANDALFMNPCGSGQCHLRDYKSWAGERGDQQLSSSKFGRRLVAIDGVSKLKLEGSFTSASGCGPLDARKRMTTPAEKVTSNEKVAFPPCWSHF